MRYGPPDADSAFANKRRNVFFTTRHKVVTTNILFLGHFNFRNIDWRPLAALFSRPMQFLEFSISFLENNSTAFFLTYGNLFELRTWQQKVILLKDKIGTMDATFFSCISNAV